MVHCVHSFSVCTVSSTRCGGYHGKNGAMVAMMCSYAWPHSHLLLPAAGCAGCAGCVVKSLGLPDFTKCPSFLPLSVVTVTTHNQQTTPAFMSTRYNMKWSESAYSFHTTDSPPPSPTSPPHYTASLPTATPSPPQTPPSTTTATPSPHHTATVPLSNPTRTLMSVHRRAAPHLPSI